MPFYVYILQSEKDGTFYKGSTENPLRRLQQHNEGLSKYTSVKRPWKPVYVEQFEVSFVFVVSEYYAKFDVRIIQNCKCKRKRKRKRLKRSSIRLLPMPL